MSREALPWLLFSSWREEAGRACAFRPRHLALLMACVPSSNLQGIWAAGSQKPAIGGMVVRPSPHGQMVMAILERRWRESDTSQHGPLPGREGLDGFTHAHRPAVRPKFPAANKFQVNFQGGN